MKILLNSLIGTAMLATTARSDQHAIAQSINTFGIELHQRLASSGNNQLTSPYSIQSALAMTYAGAAGKTRDQMAATLHFPENEPDLHAGFSSFATNLQNLAAQSRERVENPDRKSGPNTPLEINIANRLFGQKSYSFEKPFLDLVSDSYQAPLELIDFIAAPEPARLHINSWVASQTKDRINDLLPQGVINADTRLVLTNAIYIKAPWKNELNDVAEFSFFLANGEIINTPALFSVRSYGHHKIPGATIVTVPYADESLQFLLIVPDEKNGLAEVEKNLSSDSLIAAATAPERKISLFFPKFKLEPAAIKLSENLIAMGMPTAFDQPRGSADFSKMAPRTSDAYLAISEVMHKAFIAVDKYGTEAAAATAVIMMQRSASIPDPEEPLEIRVEHPFAFAIQHRETGACLFLGRVTDPR